MRDAALLDLATGLAEQAGAAILRIRAHGITVSRKPDDSPVTEADHAAEAIIVTGLRAATPDIPVVAEEEVASGRVTAPAATAWLVDPLDGTREFAAGKDEFVVNVGLVRDGRPALGAVFIPALDELFAGMVGGGAWKRDRNGKTAIHTRTPPTAGLTVVASRLHGDLGRLAAFLAGRQVERTLNFGSALKFCRVAEGAADLYPRFGRTMEWDTAAPQAVLEAAGGRVVTTQGVPLGYGKPEWENPHFICWGR
jgi:3'(2'), 5'-bisphosphate nucleotidase